MFWQLLSKNPFSLLKNHMQKTMQCIEKTRQIFDALFVLDRQKVTALAKEISQLEHECDLIKQEIRTHIAQSIFLPIDRKDLLFLLSNMDDIADNAEDVGVLLTMRWMEMPQSIKPIFLIFLNKVIVVVEESAKVIFALDRLLEAGFSGPDALEMQKHIDQVDRLEHEADKAQDQLGKTIFLHENEFSPAALLMWIKIIDKVENIADSSQRMMNHIRMMLTVKG